MSDVPWRPSRSAILVIGALSVWPFLYAGIFMASFASSWFSFSQHSGTGTAEPLLFKYIFPLHCLTMLLMFALMGIYIFHAYRTDRIEQDKKVLWVVILFFGSMVAFPIYWYLYMWRAAPSPQTPTSPSGTSTA